MRRRSGDDVYAWGNNPRRAELKGRRCRVLARGAMRSVLIEFSDNGERVVTSARAIRKGRPSLDTLGGTLTKGRSQSDSS